MRRGEHSGIQKVLWLAMMGIFLSVLIMSLFHMPISMDMSGKMSGCPFMTQEEVLCSMSVFDHLTVWKSTFAAIAPSFTLLILAFLAIGTAFVVAPNLLFRQRYRQEVLPKEIRDRIYTFSYRPLQDFFSSGILHPKLF